jgi:type I restriction enzyme M protein
MSQDQIEIKPGYLLDYISHQQVKATLEEVDAVQIFSKRLVEDYGYPKNVIQTRPQFRVRIRPSDEEKSYPIDIAVFKSNQKIEDNLFLIVECKKKTRRDGMAQLKLNMDMSPAEVGVWFNGDEHVYLRKIHHQDGNRAYEELPNIPRQRQRIEDIGLFKRKDLKKPSNLKAVFKDLRNHLAGMTTGITRDEALAQEIITVLFCKIVDEQEREPDEIVHFRAGIGEDAEAVRKRILALFDRVKEVIYDDVFKANDTINLDDESLRYVVGELQNYNIMDADRDAIGDAFEVFIGPALRGAEGQFFTPRNVVKMIVEILDPKPGEMIIDPACGSGGFLVTALEHVWAKLNEEAKRLQSKEEIRLRRRIDVAMRYFRGIDKDSFLAKVSKAYMALMGDGRGGVFCENSLARPEDWDPVTSQGILLGRFDIVLTNPPFGAKIAIKGPQILSQYDLGYKWKRNKETGEMEKTSTLPQEQPPQMLFLERCLQFLKPNGRLGIVLPESILGNPSYEHIVTFILANTTILGIVTMPESLFKTSGKGGTHTKVCILLLQKKKTQQPYNIFMADVKWCGHDSRGNPTLRKMEDGSYVLLDEVPDVVQKYRTLHFEPQSLSDHRGFLLPSDQIKNKILVPKYYNPEVDADLSKLKNTHDLIPLETFLKEGALSVTTGIEIGKMAYGTGKIPFVRTSDFSNWEIKADFKHGISEAIYEEQKRRADVKPDDILLVRDGTYLIGTTAIVTASDIPMLFQSHIYRLRVLKPDIIDPWLLFACLNMSIVKRQIRSKQFTQDIIDTLGKRLFELVIPIPKDKQLCEQTAQETREIIQTRVRLRNRAKEIALELEGIEHPEDRDILDDL